MTNTIIRGIHDKDNPYYVASRAVAQDTRLSYEALGLLTYLLSKPDNWQVDIDDLQRDGCGRDKVYRIIAELKAAGYLTRTKYRDDKGRWQWEPYRLFESPQPVTPDTEEPHTEKPDTVSPDTGNPEIKALNTDTDKIQKEQNADDDAGAREQAGAGALNIFALYHTTFGQLVSNPILADDLKDMAAEYPEQDIRDAFREAGLANSRSIKFVHACLENWRLHGRTPSQNAPPRMATAKGTGPLPRPPKPNSRVSPLPPVVEALPPAWVKAGAS